MKLVWTRPAQNDLAQIDWFLSEHDPGAADISARLALKAGRFIAENPRIGSAIDIELRKWSVRGSPYLLIYRVTADAVEILRVRHEREDWRPPP